MLQSSNRLSVSTSRVKWSEKRESRLLDWIDNHPEEREILFSDREPTSAQTRRIYKKRLTKLECQTRAAKAIFSVDEDKAIRNSVAKSPIYYAHSVYTHITRQKTAYQQCIKELGKETTNLPLEDIHRGSKAYQDIEKIMQYLPVWRRLHTYWQALPHINFFLSVLPEDRENESEDSSGDAKSGSTNWTTRKRKKRLGGIVPSLFRAELDKASENYHSGPSGTDGENSSASSPSAFKFKKKEDRTEAILNFSSLDDDSDVELIAISKQMPGYRKHKDKVAFGSAKAKQEATTAAVALEPRERDQKIQYQSRVEENSASRALSDGLTASQRHEERLAVLAIKLKELENASLEKKTAAKIRRMEIEAEERRQTAEHNNQRAKEKHEMLMRMMSVTMHNGTQAIQEEVKD